MKEIDRLTERFRYLYEKFLTGCDSLEETEVIARQKALL